MTPPLIGLTLHAEQRDGVPERLFVNRAYVAALQDAGAVVVGIPAGASRDVLRGIYERCDAVLLPGGDDVDPRRYGEVVREGCDVRSDAELDSTELELARWAFDDDKPVLAICRGMQVLNVALGGTLWQDIRTQVGHALDHRQDRQRAALVHTIAVQPESVLHRAAGVATVGVNSQHHQAVRELAPGLVATACAPDGIIEAVEHRGRRFITGVQCHPEELVSSESWSRRLFSEFVAAARG